jgi:hypothetical protein
LRDYYHSKQAHRETECEQRAWFVIVVRELKCEISL